MYTCLCLCVIPSHRQTRAHLYTDSVGTTSTFTLRALLMQLPLGCKNVWQAQKWIWVLNWIRVWCRICQNGRRTAAAVWMDSLDWQPATLILAAAPLQWLQSTYFVAAPCDGLDQNKWINKWVNEILGCQTRINYPDWFILV